MKRLWTTEEHDQLRRLLAVGKTLPECSAAMGRHKDVVRKYAKRHGMRLLGQGHPKADKPVSPTHWTADNPMGPNRDDEFVRRLLQEALKAKLWRTAA